MLEWTHKNLTRSNMAYLEDLHVTIKAFGQCFTMVHASPRDPMWEYLLDLFDAAECFPLFKTRYLLVGHTHVPIIFRDVMGVVKAAIPEPGEKMRLDASMLSSKEDLGTVGARMIINPGSVGQPRDGDPRAAYMLLELEETSGAPNWNATLTYYRVPYPVEEAQDLMESLNFPRRLISRLSLGL